MVIEARADAWMFFSASNETTGESKEKAKETDVPNKVATLTATTASSEEPVPIGDRSQMVVADVHRVWELSSSKKNEFGLMFIP
jgi:hypothetical protein